MMNDVRNNVVGGLLLFFALACAPALVGERYLLNEMIVFLIWASVAVQWNVLTGHAGVFSLGQMLLFAIGAYTVAMTNTYLGISPWFAMPIGATVAALAAVLIGLACLRLAAAYVALLTFAISYMVYVLIITETECFTTVGGGCQRFFGGTSGFSRIDDLGFRKLLRGDWIVGNYYMILGIFALSFLASIIVIHGRLGLAFRALADSPVYAAARGLDRTKFRIVAFVFSAFFTGLTGAAYAAHFRTAGPSLFDFSTLLFILAMVIVGGLRSTWGPVVGAALMMGMVEIAKDMGEIRNTMIGLVIVLFVVLMPDGIAGLSRRVVSRFRKTNDAKEAS
ncbi:branched-chain amino acid ABC transporter permease [Lutimaribacter saemankumensis]|uniref:Branched-chain amino acid transport system permease protein n=1 Tax=Lutimaribacter saemankumensis TaxID=490829 RepID=A0A1G8T6B2_9RHOB|nr:branched-chain amino acid ABC transporter permease [Lutimaribacter saemankumensis]SDJ37066.1 branched-chain amino acid transport system permease protein [Lutimaribacter saemankumensis]